MKNRLLYAPMFGLTALLGFLGASTEPANAGVCPHDYISSALDSESDGDVVPYERCTATITLNKDGSVTGELHPQDDVEDTLVGVTNNSSVTINSIDIFGDEPFDFDGDFGLDNGPTGYEGPGTSFDTETGTVFFTDGLAPGATAYFGMEGGASLENLAGGTVHTGSPPTTSSSALFVSFAAPSIPFVFKTPEPATLALFGAGLAGLGAMRRRRKAKA